jgi:hypothetical protein
MNSAGKVRCHHTATTVSPNLLLLARRRWPDVCVEHTFARDFLQFRQAFLVTKFGALLRLMEEPRSDAASGPSGISETPRFGSNRFVWVVEGCILRNDMSSVYSSIRHSEALSFLTMNAN